METSQNQMHESTNHKLYLLDKIYKDNSNLIGVIDQVQNFYDGKQYPDKNYNNMIRVVLNICSFAPNIKASKVCGTPIYLTYTADDQKTDCTALRQFDEYNCNKMHMKANNFQAALNGYVNGTEVTFVRWDDDDTTYKGIYKGGLVEEHIDLRNFAVANPHVQDIQNQAWVMFWEDYAVGAIKDMVEGKNKAEIEEKKKLIERSVSEDDEYKLKDAINHSLCRVYTRFFRIDGEVYFMCSTEKVDIFAFPHPLSRKIGNEIIKKVVEEYKKQVANGEPNENGDLVDDYKIDYEDMVMCATNSKAFTDSEYRKVKEKFSLYPFAVYRPFSRNRSFYGRSDIESLIPIQKAINFGISMNLKCAENNAYNKILVKPEALQGQKITNEPGQVITDYSGFTNQWGIKALESQPMPNGLLDFTDRLLGMTRIIYGFNDVMDGSVTNKDMSGYMLQQMIKQSNTSIEQQQQLFWLYNEEKAAIRLMYYKHYVDKARYTYEMDDATYEGEEQARKLMYEALKRGKQLKAFPNAKKEDFANPTHKIKVKEITNEELYGINFDISIEAMQGLSDSKLVEQQMWDNLMMNGGLQNIDPEILEMYLESAPNVSPRFKVALKRIIENRKQGKIAQLEGQLQQLANETNQIMNYAKRLEAQTGYQSSYLKALQSEFSTKINGQNKIISGLMKDLGNYRGQDGMSEGEVKSNNAKGISGSSTQVNAVTQ